MYNYIIKAKEFIDNSLWHNEKRSKVNVSLAILIN